MGEEEAGFAPKVELQLGLQNSDPIPWEFFFRLLFSPNCKLFPRKGNLESIVEMNPRELPKSPNGEGNKPHEASGTRFDFKLETFLLNYLPVFLCRLANLAMKSPIYPCLVKRTLEVPNQKNLQKTSATCRILPLLTK